MLILKCTIRSWLKGVHGPSDKYATGFNILMSRHHEC